MQKRHAGSVGVSSKTQTNFPLFRKSEGLQTIEQTMTESRSTLLCTLFSVVFSGLLVFVECMRLTKLDKMPNSSGPSSLWNAPGQTGLNFLRLCIPVVWLCVILFGPGTEFTVKSHHEMHAGPFYSKCNEKVHCSVCGERALLAILD